MNIFIPPGDKQAYSGTNLLDNLVSLGLLRQSLLHPLLEGLLTIVFELTFDST